MSVVKHRGLLVGWLFAIAGCTNSAQSGSPPAGSPLVPAVHHRNAAPRGVDVSYPTTSSLVFESEGDEGIVNVYETKDFSKNPPPIASITLRSGGCPYATAADKEGTLYVADSCTPNDVEEYAKGSSKLKTTITDGIDNPEGLAMSGNDTLYVSNSNSTITVYPFGKKSPSETISSSKFRSLGQIAIDGSGNLYIADFEAVRVFEVKAGSKKVTQLNLADLTEPIGVAVDRKTGYLWVTNGKGATINVYKFGSANPIETISGKPVVYPYAISIQNKGKPAGTVVVTDAGLLYAFKSGKYTPYATLTNGIENPTGVLIAIP
jgi:DNA-binding beta-propeller fold protein YncE